MDGLLNYGIAIALFTMLLILGKRPYQISDRIILVLLCTIIFPKVMDSIPYSPSFINNLQTPVARYLLLTLGPLMYLYTISLISEDFVVNKYTLLHFIPFFIFAIIGLCFHHPLAMAGGTVLDAIVNYFKMIEILPILLSFIIYSILIQIRLKNHRKKILDCFAQVTTKLTLTWLNWVVIVFFNLFVLTQIHKSLINHNLFFMNASILQMSKTIHGLGDFLFILSISYFSIRQQMIFPRSEQTIPGKKFIGEKSHGKYETSGLKDEQLQEYLTRLENHMVSEKPYLDGDLTLANLAKDLNMPKHHLSETINCKLNINFFTYINRYRIVEAKQLLQDPEKLNLTILDISLMAGFNSKSTFNIFFKKITQTSPLQFRKKHLS